MSLHIIYFVRVYYCKNILFYIPINNWSSLFNLSWDQNNSYFDALSHKGETTMQKTKTEILAFLAELRLALASDGANYSLNIIDIAVTKIKQGQPLRTELRVIQQNLATMQLGEKVVFSKKTKALLKQLAELANSGSLFEKMNDLMTTNTWPGN